MTWRSSLIAASLVAFLASCASPQARRPAATAAGTATPLSSAQPAATKPARVPAVVPALESFNQERAYVSSIGDGVISAIDLERNQIVWTLKVSRGVGERAAESAMGIAASPDGKWVYTGDVATNEVVFVNADERKIAKRLVVPHQVHAIDICERGHILWVSGRHPDYPWLSRSTIIDAQAQEIVRTFTPGLGNDAHYAFTPDVAEIWGASVTTNLVSVYDAHSGEVLAAIPLFIEVAGASPEAQLGLMAYNEVTISPDGARAYVVGPESGTVFAVDVRSRQPLKHVKVGDRTHGVAVTRDGHEVWTANNAGTVTVLDAESLDILHTISVHELQNEMPFAHVAFSYDGTRAYVSFASDIAVIDVMTRELMARIDIGSDPHEISLEDYYVRLPEGQRVTPEHDAAPVARASVPGDDAARQESRAAGITIGATLRSTQPASNGQHVLSFAVVIDTHSGDLMAIDIGRSVSVRVDGQPARARTLWTGASESIHHRSGKLDVFVDAAPARSVTLVFKDISVHERTLRFSVAPDDKER